MAPFGYTAWLWLKNNPAAQWALGIGAAIVGFFMWLALHDRRVRKGANAKAVKKAEKTATKELQKLEEKADERIEKANEAADAVSGDVTSDSLPDDTRRILFGD